MLPLLVLFGRRAPRSIVLARGKGARQRYAVVRGADWQSARIARDSPEHAGPVMRIEPSPTIRPRVVAEPVAWQHEEARIDRNR